MKHILLTLTTLTASVFFAIDAFAQGPPRAETAARAQTGSQVSMPISAIRYDVTFDSTTALSRTIAVRMSFTTSSAGEVLLSLPSWTPGSYTIGNFARYVSRFGARSGLDSLDWDKTDPDTWRIQAAGPGNVTVAFDYRADSLDTALSWTRPNFAFFNGTNLFLYPEGQGTDFVATVSVRTEPAWRVITGMTSTGSPRTYAASSYHDLVDMPFFVGRFDVDSAQAAGKQFRIATYPIGSVTPAVRTVMFSQMSKIVPQQAAIFGEVPWNTYTLLQVSDPDFPSGAAAGLEHQNSHLDIVSPIVVGNPALASLYAHEVFHAWNVKRLRPADLVPYVYDRPQPTPLLWISEGVTDYYADLTGVRARVITPEGFYAATIAKIENVRQAIPTALEDASLSAWISPVNGTSDLYYDKGSLAGLLLDIAIRDASDNQRSLDTVMRELYGSTYKRGLGFSNSDWWTSVSRAAGGRSFAEFERRYVDGRDPFPYDSILPLAGLRLLVESSVQPSLGVSVSADDQGARVVQVIVGGPGNTAGVKLGDYLVSIGGLTVSDPTFAQKFNDKYAAVPPGGTIAVQVRRGTEMLTFTAPAKFTTSERRRLIAVTNATVKAVRIRNGLLNGAGWAGGAAPR
ncbi:MAG: PDZ domain-containing protein [Gemmatimonadaceae bacterium]